MFSYRTFSAPSRRPLDLHLAGVTAAWVVALCLLVAGAVIGTVLDSHVYVSDGVQHPQLTHAASPAG
jgi:hypothetical protein